jgi:DNA modification methylase
MIPSQKIKETTTKYITKDYNINAMQTKSKSSEEILNLFKEKAIDEEWTFAEYKPSDTGKWTHSYHRYPAKFIPQLVEKLIDEYITSENAHIDDPFMGCGTTIVTAISEGFKGTGTDINKISALITKVKSTPIEPSYLDEKIKCLLGKLQFLVESQSQNLFPNTNIEPLIPQKNIDRINYWFSEQNKNELGMILRIIYDEKDETIRDFFLIAFSHILKNCSIWLQASTKPTRDFKKKPTKPYIVLKRHLKKMQRGNNSFYQKIPQKIKENIKQCLNIKIQDAKTQPTSDNEVDLIISSSPYVTSYEYADLHQLSTIWLDFADDLTEYRKEFIGSAHKYSNDKKLKSKIAQEIVNKMQEKNNKMANEIKTFFIDMQEVFNESYRILKSGGRCCYVIGDTCLKGVNILNAEVFAESLQYSGFIIDRIIKRKIPSKILPQKRDLKTGRFASNHNGNSGFKNREVCQQP